MDCSRPPSDGGVAGVKIEAQVLVDRARSLKLFFVALHLSYIILQLRCFVK